MGRYRRAAHAGLRCFFDSVRFLSSRRLFSSFYSGSRFCDCGFGFCRMGGFFTFWLVDVREKRAVVRLRGGRIRFWSCGFSCNRFAAILRSVIGGGCVDLCLYRLLGLNNGGFFVIGLFFQRCCAFFLRLRIGCLCNGFWGYIVVRPSSMGRADLIRSKRIVGSTSMLSRLGRTFFSLNSRHTRSIVLCGFL